MIEFDSRAAVNRKKRAVADGRPDAGGYATINVEAEIEPGVTIARHTHPGIESGYVLEGGLDLPIRVLSVRPLNRLGLKWRGDQRGKLFRPTRTRVPAD